MEARAQREVLDVLVPLDPLLELDLGFVDGHFNLPR